MKKMNFTSTLLRFAFLALGLVSMVASAKAGDPKPWYSRPEPCFSEKIDLNLGDPNSCETKLTTADLDGEFFTVNNFTVRKPGLNEPISGPTPVTSYTFKKSDVGLEFEVMFMSTPKRGGVATMCFVNVRVYDRTAPVYTPKNITIRCTDLILGKAPAPGEIVSGTSSGNIDGFPANSVDPSSKTRMPQPGLPSGNPTGVTITAMGYSPASSSASPAANVFTVNDCHNFSASYEDLPIRIVEACPAPRVPECTYGIITRVWTFKDRFGNISTYEQYIIVVKPRILFADEETGHKDCADGIQIKTSVDNCDADVSSAGFPFIDWNCNRLPDAGETIESGKDYCGRSITLTSVTRMNTCPGSYMLMRSWKFLDCDGKFYNVDQVVNVRDKQAPTLSLYFTDYLRVPKEQLVKMGGMCITQFVYETVVDTRADQGYKGHTSANWDDVKTIKITPLMDLGTCDQASFKIQFQIKDPKCSNGPNTISFDDVNPDWRLKVNGMLVGNSTAISGMKVDDGVNYTLTGTIDARAMSSVDPYFYVNAYDPCGNRTRIKLLINIIDNLSPTTFCEDKELTLNNNGEALLTGKMVSGGTNDNCTEYFEAISNVDDLRNPRNGRILIRRTGTDCWDEKLILTCQDLGELKVDVRAIDMMGNYTDCCVKVIVRDKSGPTCPMSPVMTTVCTDARLANPEAFFTQPAAYDNCETPKVKSDSVKLNLICGAGEATKSWTFTDRAGNSTTCTQKLIITKIEGYRVKPLASVVMTCGSYVFNKDKEIKAALANVKLLDRDNRTSCSAPVVEAEVWEYSSSEYCKIFRIRYSIVDQCRTYPTTDPSCYNRLELKDGSALLVQKEECSRAKDADGFFYDINGTMYFERFVYIRDKKAPTSVVPNIAPICVIDNTCAWSFPSIKLSGTDLCDDNSITNSNLFFNWTVEVTKADGSTKTVTGSSENIASDDLKGLKFGTYKVRYSIQDGCGNINWYEFTLTGKDCKSPYINTHDKNTVLAYTSTIGQGMSILNVKDIVNSLGDNCTSESYLRSKLRFVRAASNPSNIYPANAGTEIMFTCADFKGTNPVPVQIWTVDEAGNPVFNIAYVTVEDNTPSACGNYTPQTIIAGGLKTEGNQAAKNVTVSALNAGTIANAIATDNDGNFSFNVNQGDNYVVKAVKSTTEDKYAGVTTFDIARISKHLLDIEKFTSAYQILASDVDKSGDVDGADMLHIRNFILRKTTALPGGVWRFIDKSYSFKNPANPFGEDFPEVVSLTSSKATEATNFVAVKLGDVNATYSSNLVSTVVRNSNALTLNVEDRDLVAGNEYTVNVTADNFNAAAFQGTFNIANATIKSVKAGDLANYNDGNFGIFANAITTSWNGTAAKSANVFAVTFTATKAGKLSDALTVGSNLTPAVANDAQGTEMNINLKFSTGKVAGAEFALYQNTPNPVASETSIGFNMPKDGAAKLSIYNVEGKVVLNRNIDAKAGLNTVTINKSELSVSGVLYYRLETSEFSATKKMIIIE